MLRQLAVLSTISGGTITGVKYALCLAQGKSFEQFFEELYGFMKSDTLLPSAMAALNNSNAWQGSLKQHNLINAFALVYHDKLLDSASFGVLLDTHKTHFPELSFNSTDIEHQEPFRFQKSERGRIGHGNEGIPKAKAREIRLADIVAASSCFPGGFEPMVMPRDFAQGVDSPLNLFWSEKKSSPIRLMDGGIVDNQGIGSVLLFEERKSDDSKFPFVGTFLISDVSRKSASIPPEQEESGAWPLQFSIRQINALAEVLTDLSLLLLFVSSNKVVVMLSSIVLTLSLIWLFLGIWVARKFVALIKDTVSQESPSFMEQFNILRTIKLKYVISQINTRLTSLVRLGDVFLNRIRRLNYENLFGNKDWKYRMKTNYIYDLLEPDGVSDALRSVIKQANDMETTLWFSAKDDRPGASMLDALVVAGQATMCHNLIRYIETIKKGIYPDLPPEVQSELDELQATCQQDFRRFNDDPKWLMPKNGQDTIVDER